MKKYLFTLSVGIGIVLFGTDIALGDDVSCRRKRVPIGSDCWLEWSYTSREWTVDCGTLPEIEVVAAAPPPAEDIYHHVGAPWWHVDLFGNPYRWDPSASLWEPTPVSAVPLEVFLDLAPGQSTTIDCAPRGYSDIRKRDLIVWTRPLLNDLEITIDKIRKTSPHYGHHHAPDNSEIPCRGATSVDDGVTNKDGVFQFFYRGPEAAGRTVVTVNWRDLRDGGETGSVSMTFENRHDGLVEITGGTGISLTGHDTHHRAGDIHWVTPTTKTRIASLARLYHAKYNENLMVNDGSLRYGGLYDFNETWRPPHWGHRDGTNVDIYPTTVSAAKWKFLIRKIDELGSTYLNKINTDDPHLHFQQ